jgi:hypothetical protein
MLMQSIMPRRASGAALASCSANFMVSASRSAAADHAIHDPQLQRASRIDRRAGEAEFQRGRASRQAQQALGAAEAGNQTEVDLGLADLRGVCGESQVAAHRQFQAAAEGEAR